MVERLVVIGGVAGGATAAAKAKRVNPGLQVDVFERGEYVSYGACGLPYYIGGVIDKREKLIVRTPQQFQSQGINVHLRHEVKAIDVKKGEVLVLNHLSKREERYSYDALVIATGAIPVTPSIPGVNLKGVYTLRRLDDGIRIREELDSGRVKRAAIIGGGFIGVEVAEAFKRRGVEVLMIKKSSKVLRDFDEVVSKAAKEILEGHGITILTDCEVEAIIGRERVEALSINGERLQADLVLISKGIRPNVDLAVQGGIGLGPHGGIATNERVETNVSGVFAAGDCAETFHFLTGEPYYKPLGTTANKLGRVAGTNAAGGDARFKGVLGTTIVKVFELSFAKTGFTEAEIEKRGIPYETTSIVARDKAHYFPGGKRFTVKLNWERDTGKLLGGCMVGHGSSALRIDALATALYAGLTIEDLTAQDFAYSPPFSPVWDPLLVAANRAMKD